MPALLTSTSTPPNSSTACAMSASHSSYTRTSHAAPVAPASPTDSSSRTVCFNSLTARAATHTFKPSRDVNELEQTVRERSEEHTSEVQSQSNVVGRLLLEKNSMLV